MRLNTRATSLFLALAASAHLVVAASSEDIASADDTTEGSCGVYMAVSSTSTVDEPKWGLYAGKEYVKGMDIGFGDVAIQTYHLLANALTEDASDDEDLADVVEWFEQFIWVPQSSGGQFDLADGGRTITAIPGAGVLGGFNGRLTNSDWNHSAAYHREAWNEASGVPHEGRGAYSNFFDVGLKATRPIPPGMEIFVNYGESWEEENGDNDGDAEITHDDHLKIDQTIDKMILFFDKHEAELDDESKQEIYQFLIRDVMSAAAGSKKGAKISSMFPESPDDLKEVKAQGGSIHLTSPTALRSLSWLEEHGRCMDNIRPGPSTIPHAGRGALATRNIASGGLVSPVPLVQIPNELIFEMFPVKRVLDENKEDYFARAEDEPYAWQLVYNYCYGHPDSAMVFFPAASVASFINHANEPNAKMVWSDHPNNHKHWFDLDPETLITEGNQHLGLVMEIVATKDIQEGEEVFIDYGENWALAWKEHVKKWKASVKNGDLPSPWPTRALDLNTEYKTKPFEVEGETTYPDNVMVKCFLMVKKPENEAPVNDAGEKVRDWTEAGKTIDSENLFDCTVTDSEETAEGWLYTVRWSSDLETTIVRKVPHHALVFMDKPGTGDQFVTQSFRHYITIPDDVFPQGAWRNMYDDEDEDGDGDGDSADGDSDDEDSDDEDEDEEEE